MLLKRIVRGAAVLGLIALVLAALPQAGRASSHREAPLIADDPAADNTDLYAFVSPDRPDTVTIIANYIPLEEPAGGPNFHKFGDDVLYEIHIDNDGDSEEDITYQFRFKTQIRNRDTFLYNAGPIESLNDPDWNIFQTYSVTRVKDGKSRKLADDLKTPPVNIGPRSTPNYEALAANAVHSIDDGIKVFAGQRDDTFWVDLGSVFDLGGLRPFNNFHLIPLDPAAGVDGVGGYNTHAIAIQVPIEQLKGPDGQMVIGIYASASRQKIRVLLNDGSSRGQGPWVQVSRLGNPLINEVIIPLGKKDKWNRSDPADDDQFLQHYRRPELAALVNLLYPALPDARTTGRDDLVAILLTGLQLPDGTNLNFTGPVPADLLRLNMAIKPGTEPNSLCPATPNPMGVLGGDLCGFPNGRRLEDDVTDIELRAVADGYGAFVNSVFGALTPNNAPNNIVGDGVNENDLPLLSSFPYQSTPHQGYEHEHHRIGSTSTPPLP
ncbi:MAG TPA: DUF4331 domain-containing protein [Roseiflexaceae bacterium]|nr:DUF4331 domain-containing protein [Roseiflexaceae bacterium]